MVLVIKEIYLRECDADITIFSYDEIKDNATFDNPIKKPDGIKYVLIKGSVALKDGEIVNGKLGTSVKKINLLKIELSYLESSIFL